MKLKNIFVILSLIIIIPGSLVLGQTTKNFGVLKGQVVDLKTGTPLAGANVILLQTVLGASADLDGNFTVLKIPAGRYQVRATMMGYKSKTIALEVRAGETASIQFKLEETAIESPTLVVTASKKAQSFQDVPNSVSLISLKEIERRNKTYLNE
ncbi:MAG: carboxypeptidase-like regulatory domain-containing protein, partial [candidate division KSB1 bacterium]|nr:carboxypeptidase-like regulatory domain-containing protein [candidate division KSB1 bacterium]